MNTLTQQEIFDAALFGIRSQGYRTSAAGGACQYNGPDGTHCAIGWSLHNAGISLPLGSNSMAIDSLFHECPEARALLVGEDLSESTFVWALQTIHDTNRPDKFEESMSVLASRFGLVYSPLEVA